VDWLTNYHSFANAVVTTFAIVAGVYAASRYLNRKLERKILSEVKDATREIQPNTNGGKSLSDLHKKVDDLGEEVRVMRAAVVQLEDEVDQLEEELK